MNHISTITLIAARHARVAQAAEDLVEYAIKGAGAVMTRSVCFPDRAAVAYCCEGVPTEALRIIVGKRLAGQKTDLIVQEGAAKPKKLLLADMESTIIEQEMLDELADKIGCRAQVATITQRAMNGELDFADALRERVALLKGLPVSILDDVAARITFMAGAAALVATMKARGAQCWLVSGGFTCFVKPVAEKLGFDRYFANELLAQDGVLTGEVRQPIFDKNGKKDVLEKACAELGVSLDETLTVGDGSNDMAMLKASHEAGGLGVAFHAKPTVRAAIPNQINVGDLTALLFAQGENGDAALRR